MNTEKRKEWPVWSWSSGLQRSLLSLSLAWRFSRRWLAPPIWGLTWIGTVTHSIPALLLTRRLGVVPWWTGSVASAGTDCSATTSICLVLICKMRALSSTAVVTHTTSATATPTLGVAGSQSRSSRSCFSVYERCERDKSLLWVIIR